LNKDLGKIKFSDEVMNVLDRSAGVTVPKSRAEIVDMTLGGPDANSFDVCYDVEGKSYHEISIVRCKNGVAVNYTEDYMRRRDPDCLIIADDLPTDKPRFKDEYGYGFDKLRSESFDWLSEQELIVVPFMAGGEYGGYHGALIAPKNAAFFAAGLAGLQLFVNIDEFEGVFEPIVIIYLAPPFRHTHFNGKQLSCTTARQTCTKCFHITFTRGRAQKKVFTDFCLISAKEKAG